MRDPADDALERVVIGHAEPRTAASVRVILTARRKMTSQNLSSSRLDFEEVGLPRSLLEVRLATGVVLRNEKRAVRVPFSYREKKFVDELIVLDLDNKFDMVLGMPCKPRHDPVIDWAKRTIVRFRKAAQGAAASDIFPPTLTTERVVREQCESNQKTQIRSDLRGSRSVTRDTIVSTVVDTQVEQEEPVTEGSDLGASALGAEAIGPKTPWTLRR
ncbi:unnamed protein product [Phytophthora fragariaefolia]|uniref:Unnamed protein product n=1 Tax=Phytophthora fragariaefolia TaxID=1490495 RepID=A0A9W6XTG9_9STRA|nr:unnamed protein product [Phytophthora fragariaefolia]